jgi:hypothetical protein
MTKRIEMAFPKKKWTCGCGSTTRDRNCAIQLHLKSIKHQLWEQLKDTNRINDNGTGQGHSQTL